MYQLTYLIVGVTHHISQILTLKAHLEDIETLIFLNFKALLDIIYYLWCSRSCKRKYWHIGHQFPYLRYLQI